MTDGSDMCCWGHTVCMDRPIYRNVTVSVSAADEVVRGGAGHDDGGSCRQLWSWCGSPKLPADYGSLCLVLSLEATETETVFCAAPCWMRQ